MRIQDLRLGNIVTRKYAPFDHGIVIALDWVKTAHLHDREFPEEMLDLDGITFNKNLLERYRIASPFSFGGRTFEMNLSRNRLFVIVDDSLDFSLKYFHELQNLVFFMTNDELFDPFIYFNNA
ncbi:hypothetical protein ACLOAU_04100 [Niabella sp. CJ426]|uniref:hypothetical protein n=1 Tax=Niabella sp. CJ426 TaxID=3393740 RepID=UPI003D053B26